MTVEAPQTRTPTPAVKAPELVAVCEIYEIRVVNLRPSPCAR